MIENMNRWRAGAGIALMALVLTGLGCASSSRLGKDPVMQDVQEFDVDGVSVLLRSSAETPVVSGILFIKGGSSVIPENEPVSSEYFALRVATESGSSRTGKAHFRRKMLRMGTGISGEDGRDFSAISFRCLRENFDTSWAYFTDIATAPAFDPIEFQNLKRNVLLGIVQQRNRADVYLRTIADSIFFSGHPYGRQITQRDVEPLTLQDVEKHYKSIMVKSRLLLTVVGNISREELTKRIRETLGKLPEGSYFEQALPTPPKALTPGAYFPPFGRSLPTSYVLAYFLVPSRGDSDYYAYARLRNFFGGFLFNHIRVQNNLAYAPNLDDVTMKTSHGLITFETPYVDSAVQIVIRDVDFFRENRIREAAIREGVGRWTTSNYVKSETTQSQAVQIGQAKLLTGDWRNAFVSFDKLASVRPEQLQAAARKYLRNLNWVIIGDTSNIRKDLLMAR